MRQTSRSQSPPTRRFSTRSSTVIDPAGGRFSFLYNSMDKRLGQCESQSLPGKQSGQPEQSGTNRAVDEVSEDVELSSERGNIPPNLSQHRNPANEDAFAVIKMSNWWPRLPAGIRLDLSRLEVELLRLDMRRSWTFLSEVLSRVLDKTTEPAIISKAAHQFRERLRNKRNYAQKKGKSSPTILRHKTSYNLQSTRILRSINPILCSEPNLSDKIAFEMVLDSEDFPLVASPTDTFEKLFRGGERVQRKLRPRHHPNAPAQSNLAFSTPVVTNALSGSGNGTNVERLVYYLADSFESISSPDTYSLYHDPPRTQMILKWMKFYTFSPGVAQDLVKPQRDELKRHLALPPGFGQKLGSFLINKFNLFKKWGLISGDVRTRTIKYHAETDRWLHRNWDGGVDRPYTPQRETPSPDPLHILTKRPTDFSQTHQSKRLRISEGLNANEHPVRLDSIDPPDFEDGVREPLLPVTLIDLTAPNYRAGIGRYNQGVVPGHSMILKGPRDDGPLLPAQQVSTATDNIQPNTYFPGNIGHDHNMILEGRRDAKHLLSAPQINTVADCIQPITDFHRDSDQDHSMIRGDGRDSAPLLSSRQMEASDHHDDQGMLNPEDGVDHQRENISESRDLESSPHTKLVPAQIVSDMARNIPDLCNSSPQSPQAEKQFQQEVTTRLTALAAQLATNVDEVGPADPTFLFMPDRELEPVSLKEQKKRYKAKRKAYRKDYEIALSKYSMLRSKYNSLEAEFHLKKNVIEQEEMRMQNHVAPTPTGRSYAELDKNYKAVLHERKTRELRQAKEFEREDMERKVSEQGQVVMRLKECIVQVKLKMEELQEKIVHMAEVNELKADIQSSLKKFVSFEDFGYDSISSDSSDDDSSD